MIWLALLVAGLLEVCWAIGLKYTDGWSKPAPSIFTLVTMAGSFVLLSYALKSIPVGTAYAIWTGIGAVGVAIVGMIWLGEPRTVTRIVCIALIVIGIMGLKYYGGLEPAQDAG
jgi:quaternary ammonium compound-resistance protein SugE